MATFYSSWLKRDNTNVCRAVIEATVTSNTATAATIQLVTKLQYGNLPLWPTELATSLSIATSIGGSAASTTATVSYVRGGTQTLNTRSVTITKTHAAQSVAVSGTVTLTYRGSSQHVALAASGTQAVSAKTSYAVRYYANGGDSSAMPAAQTKWYGESLTLSSTVPTRAGFTFLGWNTNAKGTGTHYAPGATYTGNAALNLYAMWLGVSVPSIECARTDSTGAEADEGTYGTVAASWQASGTVAASVAVTARNVTASSAITLSGDTTGSVTAGGSASGNVSALFGGSLSIDTRYKVTVTVTATTTYNGGSTVTKTATTYVTYAYITMDIRVGGHGVTFGGPAVADGLHSYMPATFHDTLTAPNIGAITTANATVSVSSGSGTALCSLTLDAGTYIIEGNAGFPSNATGRRVLNLSTSSGDASASINNQTGVEVPAVSGGMTALHTTWATKRTAQTTIYLNAYQDSGAALSVTGYIRAMRIQ